MMFTATSHDRATARVAHTITDSPLGALTLVARDGMLAGVYFDGHVRGPARTALGTRDDAAFDAVIEQLDEYFRGERTRFDLRLAPQGDAFQQRVWSLLLRIPYGQTRSYGQLAAELGDASLARDVGVANARNPIAVIVPCHRVIGANGRLVGYAGGLERKQFLLDLEEFGAVMAFSLHSVPLPAPRSAAHRPGSPLRP
ncbi:MAG: methylated-DNA--[protein]-cysteine S-methyltransferase [Gemmatimonadaceae bacterium]